MSARVLFAGGGTGGHVFPLVALAEAFAKLAPTVSRAFVGTERGLEAKVIRERGWELLTLPVEPLKGRSIFGVVKGAFVAAAAVARAMRIVGREKPRLVVSIGGYAAGPIALAAAAMRVPLALLEPDRETGLTNRLLEPFAGRIYVGFEESLARVGAKGRAFGAPIRPGFSAAPARARGMDDRLRVLVVGGSQGAEFLNRTVPEAITLAARENAIEVVHQAGRGKSGEIAARYGAIAAEVIEFVDDMPARLAWADVVIARAGAITCAELCAIGRPSILVPLAISGGHQAKNAEALASTGAAKTILQRDATPASIARALVELTGDDRARRSMAEAARLRGAPDAAERITRDLLEMIGISVPRPKKSNGHHPEAR